MIDYPYIDRKGVPFRVKQITDYCWNVYSPSEDDEKEIQDIIYDSRTLEEAVAKWMNREE